MKHELAARRLRLNVCMLCVPLATLGCDAVRMYETAVRLTISDLETSEPASGATIRGVWGEARSDDFDPRKRLPNAKSARMNAQGAATLLIEHNTMQAGIFDRETAE